MFQQDFFQLSQGGTQKGVNKKTSGGWSNYYFLIVTSQSHL
jgi:hypothetical protein